MSSNQAVRSSPHPKQLKNVKRRKKQSELKKARHLELSELRKQLERLRHKASVSSIQTVFLCLGWIGTIIACAIVVRLAWLQGDSNVDKWIAVVIYLVCETAFVGMLAMAEKQIRARNWPKAFLSSVLALGLGYVALNNFDQWFRLINDHSNQERLTNALAAKEIEYLVPELTQRLTNVQEAEKQVRENAKRECDKVSGKGTICEQYTKQKGRIATAKEATDQALNDLQTAKGKAKQDTDRELASLIQKSTEAIGYRKYLPLLAPCLVLLGSI